VFLENHPFEKFLDDGQVRKLKENLIANIDVHGKTTYLETIHFNVNSEVSGAQKIENQLQQGAKFELVEFNNKNYLVNSSVINQNVLKINLNLNLVKGKLCCDDDLSNNKLVVPLNDTVEIYWIWRPSIGTDTDCE
jgi:hypothetical protein